MTTFIGSFKLRLAKLGLIRNSQLRERRVSVYKRRLRLEALESRQMLTVITVNTSADENNGINVGGRSLRSGSCCRFRRHD